MKIAVLGAGAMGSIYGGHLSMNNDVYMIDKKEDLVEKIKTFFPCFASPIPRLLVVVVFPTPPF